MISTTPIVTIKREGDLYRVSTDFGDVAVYHWFPTMAEARGFAVDRGRSVMVVYPKIRPAPSRRISKR